MWHFAAADWVYRGHQPQRRNFSTALYVAGVVLNVLHFAFAPRGVALIDVITDESKVDAGKGKNNCTAMAEWVRVNVWCGLLAAFPGFACSLAAFLLSFS